MSCLETSWLHFVKKKLSKTMSRKTEFKIKFCLRKYLKYYDAWYCSIKEISKQNFDGSTKLNFFNLFGIQIEKIASKTFEDFKNLEVLKLCEWKIKSVLMILIWILLFTSNKIKYVHPEARPQQIKESFVISEDLHPTIRKKSEWWSLMKISKFFLRSSLKQSTANGQCRTWVLNYKLFT